MNNLPCPLCKQTHPEYSVETIYFAIINQDKNILAQTHLSNQRHALKIFSPPTAPIKPFWVRVSPDSIMLLIVTIFLLIPLLFSQNLSVEQAISLVVAFMIYILFRNKLLNWHQTAVTKDQQRLKDYEIEIQVWREKTYCPIEQEIIS